MKILSLFLITLSLHTSAVILFDGDLTNLTTPSDDPGWSRVGRVGSFGSGVYVGNGWVLTANHVAAGTFTVDGDTTYSVLPGMGNTKRIRNVADTANIDLYMFRVDVTPGTGLFGLGNLDVASTTPANLSNGTHIGTGEGQAVSTTTYYIDTDPVVWDWRTTDFTDSDITRAVYSWDGDTSRDTRWNFQTMLDNDEDIQLYLSEGITEGFLTSFVGANDFGMAADNDSGSPIFFKNGSVWELSGIAHAVGTLNNQPSNTSVVGNTTFFSDLSKYQTQINDIVAIPEISSFYMVGIFTGAAALLWFRKKR